MLPPAPPQASRRRSWRWLAGLTLSLLLHLLLFGWVSGRLATPATVRQAEPAPLVAQIQLAPPPQAVPAPPAPPAPPKLKPKPKARPKARPAPQAQPAPPAPAAPQPELAQAAPAAAETAPADQDQADDAGAYNANALLVPEPAPPGTYPTYRAALPPSIRLTYHVEALRDGKVVYGTGKLSWDYNGETYAIEGQASVLFFTLLTLQSQGTIDEFGIAPVQYSEKRFRKAQTNTHFDRTDNTIRFSASTISYARPGGAQDRVSIVWQLTSIGRADGERFTPGMELDFFVAGVRRAEPWRMRVVGQEQAEVDGVPVQAWHIQRVPLPGSYEQILDVWLDPQREWYPVKLRYSETNGEYLEMSLTESKPPAPEPTEQ